MKLNKKNFLMLLALFTFIFLIGCSNSYEYETCYTNLNLTTGTSYTYEHTEILVVGYWMNFTIKNKTNTYCCTPSMKEVQEAVCIRAYN